MLCMTMDIGRFLGGIIGELTRSINSRRGWGGGRSEKFNPGGSSRPFNRVDDARWYNQQSSVARGDLRPPEAGARGSDKGVRIGSHEDSHVKFAGDKCGTNLNSNLKEDFTRNNRSSLKGKEVESGSTDCFVFTGGIKEATTKPGGVIGACGEVEKIGVAGPLEAFKGLQMSDGLGFGESPSGTELGAGVMGKVPTFGSSSSGSGAGVILFSDEGIGPTGHGHEKPKLGNVNGPRKWKKAARMGHLPNCEPLSRDLFGKRQGCKSVDVFSGDHKKPRTDASSDSSDVLLSTGRLSPTRRTQ
ncbi:hypothetical protein Q3G72_030105 [Acer saccharum]|nr:hypothetical protein Q3G72_030105 [Acer saccharum]